MIGSRMNLFHLRCSFSVLLIITLITEMLSKQKYALVGYDKRAIGVNITGPLRIPRLTGKITPETRSRQTVSRTTQFPIFDCLCTRLNKT